MPTSTIPQPLSARCGSAIASQYACFAYRDLVAAQVRGVRLDADKMAKHIGIIEGELRSAAITEPSDRRAAAYGLGVIKGETARICLAQAPQKRLSYFFTCLSAKNRRLRTIMRNYRKDALSASQYHPFGADRGGFSVVMGHLPRHHYTRALWASLNALLTQDDAAIMYPCGLAANPNYRFKPFGR